MFYEQVHQFLMASKKYDDHVMMKGFFSLSLYYMKCRSIYIPYKVNLPE